MQWFHARGKIDLFLWESVTHIHQSTFAHHVGTSMPFQLLVAQTTYIIISLVTVHNPVIKIVSAPMWFRCEFSKWRHSVSWKDVKKRNWLKDIHRKKHGQIKLQCLQKVQIWEIGLLVHQINSLQEVLKLKHNFQKNTLVAGKTQFFVIGPFCSHHSICLNIDFWHGSFVWKWRVFDLSAFSWEMVFQFFEKGFRFLSRKPVSKLKYWKRL